MALKLEEFVSRLKGDILTNVDISDKIISDGYVSDLLSDVMAHAQENQAWITIMKHLNSIAVASLSNIPCIVFANGIKPNEEVIAKANEEKVCLISSKLSSFHIAGRLYKMLND